MTTRDELLAMAARWRCTDGRPPNEVENERRKCGKELEQFVRRNMALPAAMEHPLVEVLRHGDLASPSVEEGPRPEVKPGEVVRCHECSIGKVTPSHFHALLCRRFVPPFPLPAPSPEAHARCPECEIDDVCEKCGMTQHKSERSFGCWSCGHKNVGGTGRAE